MNEELRTTLKSVLCTGETLEQFCDRIDKDLEGGELRYRDAYRVLRHVMTGLIHLEKGGTWPGPSVNEAVICEGGTWEQDPLE